MKKILFLVIWMMLATACDAQDSGRLHPEESEIVTAEPAGEPAAAAGEQPRAEQKKRAAKPKKQVVKSERKKPQARPKKQPAGEPAAETTTLAAVESPAVVSRPEEVSASAMNVWNVPALTAPSLSQERLPAGAPAETGYGLTAVDETRRSAAARPRKQNRFLPMRRRIDRKINQGRFAYKGELIMGLTASYGTMSNDDTDFLVILESIDLDGTIATVKPFVGYFYRDNRCVGIRFGYQHMGGKLGNLDLDLGEQNDISMNIGGMELTNDSYSFGLFHRSYVGLDRRGRFGLFAEVEASVTTGSSDFVNGTGESAKATYSDSFKAKLSFNPGMAVYIFPNVCTTVSIGLGGIQYSSVTQRDAEGNKTGSRNASKMRFRLNIADINFGVSVHLWDKKKK